MGEVLGARGNTKAKTLRQGGTLFVRITTAPTMDLGRLQVKLQGVKLKNTDGLFGKSDPFVEVSAKVNAAGGLKWHPIYRSLPVMDNLNPSWPEFSLNVSRICDDGNLDKPLLIEVRDWEKSGKHGFMGKFETSINGLMASQVQEVTGKSPIDTSRGFSITTKKKKEAGMIVVTLAQLVGYPLGQSKTGFGSIPLSESAPTQRIELASKPTTATESIPAYAFSEALNRPPPTTGMTNLHLSETGYDSNPKPLSPMALPPPLLPPTVQSNNFPASLISSTTRPKFTDYLTGGCELELSIAIDFTGSNGDPRRHGTLHFRHPDGVHLNDYEKAITAVGGVIARYDSDQKFPAFGFGAKYGGVIQHCFQIGASDELDGVGSVLDAYRSVFHTGLTMSGPTIFSEVINYTAAQARSKHESSQRIGQQSYKILLILTDGEVTDLEETKRAIHGASDAPLSIVIVGIGNADFGAMQHLDDFQDSSGAGRDIVQFVQFSQHANNRAALARATLEEIPDQMVDFFMGRGIRPLPPISGSQIFVSPEGTTDEDIDLSIDVQSDGTMALTDYNGAVYDDTKYATLTDYSTLKPVPVPTAPYYPMSVPVPTPPPSFLVQVPPYVSAGMQLQIQNPNTNQSMIVTVPPGVPPGGTFPVKY